MKRICLSVSNVLALLLFVAAVVATAPTAKAQTRDKYLISAKAGGVNYVSGNVTVKRADSDRQESLTDKDNLENGDVVTTGMGGRVEVLLSPGSYLRVGENSEFQLADTSLDNIRIKLSRGSAIIEAIDTDNAQLAIRVDTPQTAAQVVKAGIYRINVTPAGATEVLVRKGRALVGTPAATVKSGKMVVVNGGTMQVAKLDKKMMDSLELWSRDRAEYLASINRQLQPRTLMASIIDYSADNNYSSYREIRRGTWVYDHLRGCYVFVPGNGYASSPYGYGYGTWGSSNCECVNGRGRMPQPNNGGGTGGGGGPIAGNPPSEGNNPGYNGGGNNGGGNSGGGGGGGGNESPAPAPSRFESAPPSNPAPPSPPSPPATVPSSPANSSGEMMRSSPNN